MMSEHKPDLSVGEKTLLKTRDGVSITLHHIPKSPADFFELGQALVEETAYKGTSFEEISFWITFNGPKWSPYDKRLNILKLSASLMRNASAQLPVGAQDYEAALIHRAALADLAALEERIAILENINTARVSSTASLLKRRSGIDESLILPSINDKISKQTIRVIKNEILSQKISLLPEPAKSEARNKLARSTFIEAEGENDLRQLKNAIHRESKAVPIPTAPEKFSLIGYFKQKLHLTPAANTKVISPLRSIKIV